MYYGGTNMELVKLSQYVKMDYVSSEKGWGYIYNAIKDIDADTRIDMTDVQVSMTTDSSNFVNILNLPHIFLKMKCDENSENEIKIFMTMDNIPNEKVEFVERVVAPVKDKNAEKIEKNTQIMMNSIFKIEGDHYVLKFSDGYSHLSTSFIDEVIFRSIHKKSEESGVKKFIADFSDIVIEDVTMTNIANRISQLIDLGITIEAISNNKGQQNILNIALNNAMTAKMTVADKAAIVKKMFKGKPIPGIYLLYQMSKSVDTFGRSGKGAPIMVRIATLNSIDDSGTMKFTTYNKDTFFTKEQWCIEHDGETLESLDTQEFTTDVASFGFMNEFMGANGHFLRAAKQDPSETTMVVASIDDNGQCIKKLCSLAERMKIVFDSWGIEYDHDIMEESIKEAEQYKIKKE